MVFARSCCLQLFWQISKPIVETTLPTIDVTIIVVTIIDLGAPVSAIVLTTSRCGSPGHGPWRPNASADAESVRSPQRDPNSYRRRNWYFPLLTAVAPSTGSSSVSRLVALTGTALTRHAGSGRSGRSGCSASGSSNDPSLVHVDSTLRAAFLSGYAAIHDWARIPAELRRLPNGHEGSHHFLVDDFVVAVTTMTLPPVNAWVAARFTIPGIVAHNSALRGGEHLPIIDLGEPPAALR